MTCKTRRLAQVGRRKELVGINEEAEARLEVGDTEVRVGMNKHTVEDSTSRKTVQTLKVFQTLNFKLNTDNRIEKNST